MSERLTDKELEALRKRAKWHDAISVSDVLRLLSELEATRAQNLKQAEWLEGLDGELSAARDEIERLQAVNEALKVLKDPDDKPIPWDQAKAEMEMKRLREENGRLRVERDGLREQARGVSIENKGLHQDRRDLSIAIDHYRRALKDGEDRQRETLGKLDAARKQGEELCAILGSYEMTTERGDDT